MQIGENQSRLTSPDKMGAMTLAPYAVDTDASAARRYPEPRHAYRSPYQRDHGRVIHARAFRRLEDKTQVFTDRTSDHFRNRLTHTIEVAQITRTVAEELDLNEELAETLALVHDIGHPPFGHAGERRLDQLMCEFGERGFDHNLHALRIVEYVEHRYPGFRGLNLTFAVREGIVKHSRDWDPQDFPELTEYMLTQRPPLEAQLIDITDEIAYNTADLDDGVEADILTVEQIREAVPLFSHFYAQVQKEYPCIRQQVCLLETIKRMLDYFVSDLIETTRAELKHHGLASLEEVRRFPGRLAHLSHRAEAERTQTKQFLYDQLYNSPRLRAHKEHGEQVIDDLFRHWMNSPGALPKTYQRMAGLARVEADDSFIVIEPLPRIVCDYIAGMTDGFCLEQHQLFIGSR